MKKIYVYCLTVGIAFLCSACGSKAYVNSPDSSEVSMEDSSESIVESSTYISSEDVKETTVFDAEGPAINANDNTENGSYAENYKDLINRIEQEDDNSDNYKYSLIYLDEDDVPELVVDYTGYYLSVYTYKDGEVVEQMDKCGYGVGGCVGYEYAPYKNSIRTFGHGTEDYGTNLYVIKDNELFLAYSITCYYDSEKTEYTNNTEEQLSNDELESRFKKIDAYEYEELKGEYSADEILTLLN